MSDYTPEKPTIKSTPAERYTRWWILSLALHAASLCALLASPSSLTAGSDPSANIEKAIAERQEEEERVLSGIQSQVAQLEKIERQIRELNSSSPTPQPQTPKPETLAELYEHATQAEANIAQQHKEIRAEELAAIREMPVEQALREMDAPQPVRPRLDLRSLPASNSMSTPAEKLQAQQQAATARQEIGNMVAASQKMLAQAQRQKGQTAGTGSTPSGAKVGLGQNLSGGSRDTARQKQLSAAVQASQGRRVQDLTGLMKEDSKQSSGGSADTYQSEYSAIDQEIDATLAELDSREILRSSIPSRKVMKGGQNEKWLFADSWYTIGPFPNPNRANLNRRFPPETIVDLDAEYSGKDNRPVRWKFVQTANPRTQPAAAEEYAVYYAYTELWFEEPRDLWIAVGGDDKATLWLNDQQVWISGDQLKGWRAGEALRKVHFKKGLNRVLFRVENGWKDVAFSLAIALRKPF